MKALSARVPCQHFIINSTFIKHLKTCNQYFNKHKKKKSQDSAGYLAQYWVCFISHSASRKDYSGGALLHISDFQFYLSAYLVTQGSFHRDGSLPFKLKVFFVFSSICQPDSKLGLYKWWSKIRWIWKRKEFVLSLIKELDINNNQDNIEKTHADNPNNVFQAWGEGKGWGGGRVYALSFTLYDCLFFFRLYFRNCLRRVDNWDDLLCLFISVYCAALICDFHTFTLSSSLLTGILWIHTMATLSWLVSSSQRSWVRIPYKPKSFSATA